jgi:hypothetical protein
MAGLIQAASLEPNLPQQPLPSPPCSKLYRRRPQGNQNRSPLKLSVNPSTTRKKRRQETEKKTDEVWEEKAKKRNHGRDE